MTSRNPPRLFGKKWTLKTAAHPRTYQVQIGPITCQIWSNEPENSDRWIAWFDCYFGETRASATNITKTSSVRWLEGRLREFQRKLNEDMP